MLREKLKVGQASLPGNSVRSPLSPGNLTSYYSRTDMHFTFGKVLFRSSAPAVDGARARACARERVGLAAVLGPH